MVTVQQLNDRLMQPMKESTDFSILKSVKPVHLMLSIVNVDVSEIVRKLRRFSKAGRVV